MAALTSYKLLIVTPIPVVREGRGYRTLDLWVRDLQTQVATTGSVTILALPAQSRPENTAEVPEGVRVVTDDQVKSPLELQGLVEQADVVAVNTGSPRRHSQMQYRAAEMARRLGRCLIACVTSNPVKTTLLNSRGKSMPRRIQARLVARSIERTQRRLVAMSDGVLVVGHGVSAAMRFGHPNEYVETASWIRGEDLLPEARLAGKLQAIQGSLSACIATRLEPMKGVHLGIEAMRLLGDGPDAACRSLTIFGAGSALGDLQSLVAQYGLEGRVTFGGTFAYPEPFLSEIGKFDVILLTNLNDEQPRLIFDALARGVLPICPDSEPYRRLGLPDEIQYRRGDAEALAHTLRTIHVSDAVPKLMARLTPMLRANTADAMHQRRAEWILRTLNQLRDRRLVSTS